MKKTTLVLLSAILSMTFFTGCDPEVPDIDNEEEVITTLRYTLTPNNGDSAVVFSFQDLDGDGGNAPVISEGVLDSNTAYIGSLELLNETETPIGDIGEEVLEEGTDHQLFFSTTLNGLTISYDDMDTEGKPIGLATNVTTTAAGNGTLTITLRHEPIKDAAGVSNGDIANADGETDIEVTFNVIVQ